MSAISTRSAAAFVYLVFIGSIIGFTAYVWLLQNTTPAKATTYAYVNPVVAVFLGWAIRTNLSRLPCWRRWASSSSRWR